MKPTTYVQMQSADPVRCEQRDLLPKSSQGHYVKFKLSHWAGSHMNLGLALISAAALSSQR